MDAVRFPGSVKCKRPRMTDRSGRTWDQCAVVDAAGVKLTGYLDTSWGHYFYFMDGEQWRKARVDKFMTGFDNTADFSAHVKAKSIRVKPEHIQEQHSEGEDGYWIELKKGWCWAGDYEGCVHCIHEPTKTKALREKVQRCNCKSCQS